LHKTTYFGAASEETV